MEETQKEIPKEVDEKGKFNRQGNRFSTPFGDGPDELPVEAGRYRLLWSANLSMGTSNCHCKKYTRIR